MCLILQVIWCFQLIANLKKQWFSLAVICMLIAASLKIMNGLKCWEECSGYHEHTFTKGADGLCCIPMWVFHMCCPFTSLYARDLHNRESTGQDSGLRLPCPRPRISFIFARQPSLPPSTLNSWARVSGALGLGTILDCCIVSDRELIVDWVGLASSNFSYIMDTIRSVAFIVCF